MMSVTVCVSSILVRDPTSWDRVYVNVNGGVPVKWTLNDAGSSPAMSALYCVCQGVLAFSKMYQTLLNLDRW